MCSYYYSVWRLSLSLSLCVSVSVCVCVFGCGLSMREGGKLEKVTKEGRVWAACVGVIACSHPGVHKKYL